VTITGNKVGPDGKKLKEVLELWSRDIIGVIRELLENSTYGNNLVFVPCREWSGAERKYGEMWTGEWWWKVQVSRSNVIVC
jgi:hypothetical protein